MGTAGSVLKRALGVCGKTVKLYVMDSKFKRGIPLGDEFAHDLGVE